MKIDKNTVIKIGVLVGLFITAYFPVLIWMVDRWASVGSYYSHGFLIPIVSVFIVWRKRKFLDSLVIKPSRSGWLVFISGLVLYLLGILGQVYFVCALSFVVVIAGLILLFLGRKHFDALIFPVSFLFFMIPLPLYFISNISFKLKILCAKIAVVIVKYFGITAVRQGSIIQTPHAYLVVEDPCSGIRSLIAFIALGFLMAYLSRLRLSRKLVLCVSSVFVALISNIVRIIALTLISEIFGVKYITAGLHDVLGVLVFIFAFILLNIIAKLLE